MIDVRNLSYRYPGAEQLALDQITLEIPSAAFALVVGPSGCGKSTLVRCINGLVPHFSGGQVAGEIRVNGRDPIALGPQGMSDLVGCVFQDPEAQAVMDRVEDEIAFALEYGGMNRQDMRIRVEETLDLLDLALLRTRKLDTLSGGERQRVAIAAALALRPHILILDEPTSQLDPQSAEDVLQALVRLNSDLGLTIVLVEHRLERVLPFVDQIIALSSEGSVQVGTPDTVLPHLAQVPPLVALGKALGWSPLPLTIKAGLRFSRGYAVPSAIPPVSSGASSKPLLQMLHVDAGYDGHLAVRDVSLGIASGEIVALLGRNGAGKSTILRCLVGLLCPIRGRVLLDGVDIAGRDVASICQRVGYLPQDPNALLFADTVREEVLITLRNHGIQDVSRADALLAQLGLADKAKAYPRDLSVGERQRVALAVISVPRPKVLLLDEPTRGLDSAAKQMLADLLHTWRTQSMAICVVTHDVEFVALLANRVIILGRGEIIADGSTISVLGNSPLFAPQIARLFPTTNWLTLRDAFNALL